MTENNRLIATNGGALIQASLKEGGVGLVIKNSPQKYYAEVDDYVIGVIKGRV